MHWLIFLIILFVTCPDPIIGQPKDYAKLREKILVKECGVSDRTTSIANLEILETLDTNSITRNIHQYYEDLALYHWKLGKLDDAVMQDKFISYSHKALYHKPDSQTALWNLSMGYYLRNDCVKARQYITQYKLGFRNQGDPEHERMIYEKCLD